jgi:hypothetical protein
LVAVFNLVISSSAVAVRSWPGVTRRPSWAAIYSWKRAAPRTNPPLVAARIHPVYFTEMAGFAFFNPLAPRALFLSKSCQACGRDRQPCRAKRSEVQQKQTNRSRLLQSNSTPFNSV